MKTRMNGSRTSGLVRTAEKFARPMPVFQPGSSSSPPAATNDPLSLSRKTVPSSIRVNVSATGS